MKKIMISMLAILFTSIGLFAQNNAIDKFFDAYQDNEDFSVVYVSPKMFQMLAKVATEELDEDVNAVVKDLKGLKILRTDVNSAAVYKDAVTKINTKEYELLLTARDKGQNVNFYTKTSGSDVIEELLLLVGGEKEFVLLSFVGTLDLDKIAKLASKLNMDGAEHLEKLKKD
jgi:vacuolar-type H+-ATPase subunit I/STV1